MPIGEGDRVPDLALKSLSPDGMKDLSAQEIFGGKKVVLFAVPGAFTPTCSNAHLPGFVVNADKIKAKGVDSIICLSVNDAFVMQSWGKDRNAEDIVMAGDGNAQFTKAMGLEMDGSSFGLGTRSQRYALIADDGVITKLNIEDPGKLEISSAEAILEAL